MSSDEDTRRFLPPGFNDQLHRRQPPSSATNSLLVPGESEEEAIAPAIFNAILSVSDIPSSCSCQETPPTRRNPRRRTISTHPNSTTTDTTPTLSSNNFPFKRLRMMVGGIEEKSESGVAEEHGNPSQQHQVKEDCVVFRRLEDGSLRIQLSCSCCKRFEFLCNHNDCFYRLI